MDRREPGAILVADLPSPRPFATRRSVAGRLECNPGHDNSPVSECRNGSDRAGNRPVRLRSGTPETPLRIAYLGDSEQPAHSPLDALLFLERATRSTSSFPAATRSARRQDPGVEVQSFRGVATLRGCAACPPFKTARSLRRLIGRIRPDVLHAHYVTRYATAAWLSGFPSLCGDGLGFGRQAALRTSWRHRIKP